MSDDIPFEIQMEIIERMFDVKSVVRYRSVSKAWKSTIDSKDFVTAHTLRHHQAHDHHHLLLIRKQDSSDDGQVNYVSIVDDVDTFPSQKLSVFVPDSVNEFFTKDSSIIIDASHGLFCLYEYHETNTAVIWNPAIRKAVAIAVPAADNVFSEHHCLTVVGFGICPRILDPKLVKITYWGVRLRLANTDTQVEVFTLRGGTWRSPLSGNVLHKSIRLGDSQVAIDGVIYWNAFDRIDDIVNYKKHRLIVSFDLTSEEFTKVNLPDSLGLNPARTNYISISNLRESLAVLEINIYDQGCQVWLMSGHGCTRSFIKIYSITEFPDASIYTILGFRKNGAPLVEVKINHDKQDYYSSTRALAIYELESKSITNIGIHGLIDTFSVHSYTETLLLLGH